MLNIESENGTPLDNQIEKADHQDETADENVEPFDYTHVHAVARIALYDDLRSAPRVTEIHPAPTAEFIESLASKIYEQAKNAGGTIPYTVIREVSENFIHARFAEATVSILDEGNTIRFADQGPGIPYKDQAQIPGFTSAVEPMKHYIRGVGSGLPIVKEYLDFSHGTITIEDNLGTGAVVTISLRAGEATDMPPVDQSSALHPASAQPSAMEPAYPMHEAPPGAIRIRKPTVSAGSRARTTALRLRARTAVRAPALCAESLRGRRALLSPARCPGSSRSGHGHASPACDGAAYPPVVATRARLPAHLPERRSPGSNGPVAFDRRAAIKHVRGAVEIRGSRAYRENGRTEAHSDRSGIPRGKFPIIGLYPASIC